MTEQGHDHSLNSCQESASGISSLRFHTPIQSQAPYLVTPSARWRRSSDWPGQLPDCGQEPNERSSAPEQANCQHQPRGLTWRSNTISQDTARRHLLQPWQPNAVERVSISKRVLNIAVTFGQTALAKEHLRKGYNKFINCRDPHTSQSINVSLITRNNW